MSAIVHPALKNISICHEKNKIIKFNIVPQIV